MQASGTCVRNAGASTAPVKPQHKRREVVDLCMSPLQGPPPPTSIAQAAPLAGEVSGRAAWRVAGSADDVDEASVAMMTPLPVRRLATSHKGVLADDRAQGNGPVQKPLLCSSWTLHSVFVFDVQQAQPRDFSGGSLHDSIPKCCSQENRRCTLSFITSAFELPDSVTAVTAGEDL